MTILDSIRQVVADDAAHSGVTHELYLTRATVLDIEHTMMGHMTKWGTLRGREPSLLVLPIHVQNVGADCIATLRAGQIISVTNLKG